MDEEREEAEEIESTSSDSFIDDLENDELTTSGQDDGLHLEASHSRFVLPFTLSLPTPI